MAIKDFSFVFFLSFFFKEDLISFPSPHSVRTGQEIINNWTEV